MTLALGALAVAAALLTASCSEAPLAQPLPFNHKIHVTDNGFRCSACHQGVEVAAAAGLPRTEVCFDCHWDDITMNEAADPQIALIREHADAGSDLLWIRVTGLPSHVNFSHRRHVAVERIACDRCHGEMGERVVPPEASPIVHSMDWCLECHRSARATTDCLHCHR